MQVDVWSLGCILAELLSGAVLLQARTHRAASATCSCCLGTCKLGVQPDDLLCICVRAVTTWGVHESEHSE